MAGDAILATAILAGMCGVMWFLARLAKKRMGIGSGVVAQDALRIVGKRPLDQKNALWVVEIAGGRHILLGTSTDGGGVTKLDDISADEYAAMVDQEAQEAATRRPKLRVAAPGTTATTTDASDDSSDDEAADEQRFATLGESFNHFLGKAKEARTNRKASGE